MTHMTHKEMLRLQLRWDHWVNICVFLVLVLLWVHLGANRHPLLGYIRTHKTCSLSCFLRAKCRAMLIAWKSKNQNKGKQLPRNTGEIFMFHSLNVSKHTLHLPRSPPCTVFKLSVILQEDNTVLYLKLAIRAFEIEIIQQVTRGVYKFRLQPGVKLSSILKLKLKCAPIHKYPIFLRCRLLTSQYLIIQPAHPIKKHENLWLEHKFSTKLVNYNDVKG